MMLSAHFMSGQKEIVIMKGIVTYVSSQNVYVKFYSTADIIMVIPYILKKDELLIPGLIVKFKSNHFMHMFIILNRKDKNRQMNFIQKV